MILEPRSQKRLLLQAIEENIQRGQEELLGVSLLVVRNMSRKSMSQSDSRRRRGHVSAQ